MPLLTCTLPGPAQGQKHWPLLFSFCELIIKEGLQKSMNPSIRPVHVFLWLAVRLTVLGGGALRAATLPHTEMSEWWSAWAESGSNSCTETERSFGFAPPKHQLSPPISLVVSTLLIQWGAWGALAQMVHRLTALSRVSGESLLVVGAQRCARGQNRN